MSFRKVTALAALVVVMAAFLVPVMSDSSEALTDGDVTVSTMQGTTSVDLDLESGSSTTFQIVVINRTEEPVGVTIDIPSMTDVSISYEVESGSELLQPASSGDNTALFTFTLTADVYADSGDHQRDITVYVTDFGDGVGNTVAYTIGVHVSLTSAFASGDSYNKILGVIPNTLPSPFDNVWVTAIITIIIWLLVTVIVCKIVLPLLTRRAKEETAEQRKKLVNQLTLLISCLMFIVALNECAQIVGMGGEVVGTLSTISSVLYVLLIAFIAWKAYAFAVDVLVKAMEKKAADYSGLDTSIIPLLNMVGELVIAVVAVLAICTSFGVDLAGILISAGVVALGITIGAQEALGQFFGGVVLLTTRPFKPGDFVKINGETYIVRKVKLMQTEFINWDQDQIITIPNSNVTSATVVNLSAVKYPRVFVYVGVAYGTDVALAKKCLENAGMRHPRVIKDGSVSPPNARFTDFLDSGMELRLACYVDDYDSSGSIAGELRELVVDEFREHDVEIPYNRVEVDMLGPETGAKSPRSI